MSRFIASAFAAVMMLAATTAHADVITDWNRTALEVLQAGSVGGNPGSRAMAMGHVAMSDAINSVQGRYTRDVFAAPVAPNASAEAAAVSAAREIFLPLVPPPEGQHD